jgi:uncharacterized protein YukE
MDAVKELKAKAYDVAIEIERLQGILGQINRQIRQAEATPAQTEPTKE